MTLGINTNIATLNAQRQLAGKQSMFATSMQRLSSGMRINSARDDAAGLQITGRFSSQIRGSEQAARNANDGISMLQTADGTLASVSANLQRIRELAVQAANAIMSDSDRLALQGEARQLVDEIQRIYEKASFNGTLLFEKSRTVIPSNLQSILDGLKSGGGWLENAEQLVTNFYGITADKVALTIDVSGFTDGAGGVAAQVQATVPSSGKASDLTLQVDAADFTATNLPDGGNAPLYSDRLVAREMVRVVLASTTNYGLLMANPDYRWFLEGATEFIHGADERLAADIAARGGGAAGRAAVVSALANGFQEGSSLDYSASYAAIRYMHQKIQAAGGSGVRDIMVYLSLNPNATLDNALANASSGAFASNAAFLANFATQGGAFIATLDLADSDTGSIGGGTASSVVPNGSGRGGNDVLEGFVEKFKVAGVQGGNANIINFQLGPDAGQVLGIQLGTAISLGDSGLDAMADAIEASSAIVAADRALEQVLGQRAQIGAQLSRMETTISNLQTSTENLSSSRSRMEDADFAMESASNVRSRIMMQAGNAITAQANLLPRQVLMLLRNR